MTAQDLPDSEKARLRLQRICRDDRWLVTILCLMVAIIVAVPFLPVVKGTSYLSVFAILLFFAAIGIAGLRNSKADWVKWLGHKTPGLVPTGREALMSFHADRLAMRIIALTAVPMVFSS